jgi:hypothetical protein
MSQDPFNRNRKREELIIKLIGGNPRLYRLMFPIARIFAWAVLLIIIPALVFGAIWGKNAVTPWFVINSFSIILIVLLFRHLKLYDVPGPNLKP